MTNLKRLILSCPKPQSDIAREAGISKPSLSRYANGHRDIPLSVAIRLARAIGCGVEDMAGEDTDRR